MGMCRGGALPGDRISSSSLLPLCARSVLCYILSRMWHRMYIIDVDDIHHIHVFPSNPLGRCPHMNSLGVSHRSKHHVADGGLSHIVSVALYKGTVRSHHATHRHLAVRQAFRALKLHLHMQAAVMVDRCTRRPLPSLSCFPSCTPSCRSAPGVYSRVAVPASR